MSLPTLAPETSFISAIAQSGAELVRRSPAVLQLNVGRLCNLTCTHCHVNAGPKRKEILQPETRDRILDWFEQSDIHTLDLTGGTPEMIPGFRDLVERVRSFDRPRRIMDRLNATIINEPGFDWVAEFLADNEVEIIASMPCYQPENVNAQRGEGVFDRSIAAFQKLNELGYGKNPSLPLTFVYNPGGAFLPPPQADLEADYRREMRTHFGIEFTQLFCLTNMPISRFASYLKRHGEYEAYLQLLRESFNPSTVDGLMCRDTISVSWEGHVFDCDFNQMLDMPTGEDHQFLWDLDVTTFQNTPIALADHCFGCTAGSGSSCGGALED